MDRKLTAKGANIIYLIVLVLFVVFSIVEGIISAVLGRDLSNEYFGVILLITQYVLILAPVLIYAAVKKLNIREFFRIKPLGILPAFVIIAAALPAIYVAGTLNSIAIFLLQYIGSIPPNPIPTPHNLQELAVGIVLVAVSPAICEEALHRGLLLRAYEKRGSLKAVVITSIFFGVFHFDITNLLGPIFLGLLIGYYVIRTNSILAGVLAHFTNNAIAEVFSYIARNSPQADKITITAQELGYQVIFGFGGLMLVYLFVKLFNIFTEGKAVLNPPISNIKRDIVSIISHWPVIIVQLLYFIFFILYILSIAFAKISETGF